MKQLTLWRKKSVALVLLLGITVSSALGQCQYAYATCWHCVRNTCWSQAGQVSYWGSYYSHFCNVSSYYSCGAGECNNHYLEVTSVCDGVYYGAWGFICCDVY